MGKVFTGWESTVRALLVIRDHPEQFPFAFDSWLLENRELWCAFEREARLVWARGYRHYSARTIIHFLRHHSALTETDCAWKINNNHSPYLGRVFELAYPDMAGFFERRSTKVERRMGKAA